MRHSADRKTDRQLTPAAFENLLALLDRWIAGYVDIAMQVASI